MIDWHTRFLQQAAWTRPLREYLYKRCGLDQTRRLLEVGCGTGAILAELSARVPELHGTDHDPGALLQARRHAPRARLSRGDALALPYAARTFDITCCHFFLLWLDDPLGALVEMRRVTLPGGYVLAMAEPDYLHRVDRPQALAPLGRMQAEALRRQGADPGLGSRLADLFRQAALMIVESGPLQAEPALPAGAELEWAVLQEDVAGLASHSQLERWKSIDQRARAQGRRVLHVPTYFACGRVPLKK